MSFSTHVLDAGKGCPAHGVTVELHDADGVLATGVTDVDGRWGGELAGAGAHRIRFDTGAWFAAAGRESFYPAVTVEFTVDDPSAKHHVPLLLSPFAYSTYRGS